MELVHIFWVKGGRGGVYQKNFFRTPLPLIIINSLQRDYDFLDHFIIIRLLSKDSNRLWGSRVGTGADGLPPANPRSWLENPTTRFPPKRICYRIFCKILAFRSHHQSRIVWDFFHLIFSQLSRIRQKTNAQTKIETKESM